MQAMIVGGERNGEMVDVLDGSTAWVNIRTAETYRVRAITWAVGDPATGQPVELWRLMILVWPGLSMQGPQIEQEMATSIVTGMAMGEYMRAHAVAQELPAPTALEIPDSPAALLRPGQ
jgi:hypothetical protein